MNILLESLSVLANGDPQLFAKTIRRYGFEVIGYRNIDPLEKHVQLETIESMASMITESIDEDEELNPIMIAIKQLAESHGYIVRLIDEAPVVAPPRTMPGTRPKPGEKSPIREPKRTPWNPPRPAKLPKPKAAEPEEDDDEGFAEGSEDQFKSPPPPPPPKKRTGPQKNAMLAKRMSQGKIKNKIDTPKDAEANKRSWQGNPFGND